MSKTKIVKQPAQQTSKSAANDAPRTAFKPTATQVPLPNQRRVNMRLKMPINAWLSAV